jgi:hypothetical protein
MSKRWYALLTVLALVTGCASVPEPGARSILDTQSGNTLLLATRPLVFARRRTDVAAEYARDYATLVAVELDVAGNYSDYLLLYRWSTVDTRMSPLPGPASGTLRIEADGRNLVLTPLAQAPVDAVGRDDLYYPQHAEVVTYGYKVDVATLRFIALSRRISLRMPQDALDIPFGLREDGRASLAEFVKSEGVVK